MTSALISHGLRVCCTRSRALSKHEVEDFHELIEGAAAERDVQGSKAAITMREIAGAVIRIQYLKHCPRFGPHHTGLGNIGPVTVSQ